MKKTWKVPAILLLWLLIWQAADLAVDNPILFAGPADVLAALFACVKSAGFWLTVCSSLLRICAGFSGAAACGILLGAAACRFSLLRELLAPVMLLCKSIPVASFVILALIWMGSANLSIFISFLVVLPLLYTATLTGLSSADPKLLELAGVFRFSLPRRIRAVYLPALAPHLSSSADSALGLAVKSGVAAEVIGVPDHSIGGELYLAKIYLNTADLFAWTLTIILCAWLLERALRLLLARLDPAAPRLHSPVSPVPNPISEKEKPHRAPLLRGPLPSLQIEGLSKSFGARPVLSDLSLAFPGPGIYCVMAPSGAGKTTLFRILMGLESADGGRIRFLDAGQGTGKPAPDAGQSAGKPAPDAGQGAGKPAPDAAPGLSRREVRMAAIFQEDRLIEFLTPLENAALALPGRSDPAVLFAECSRILPGESLTRPVRTLSGGMRRRCCLMRALLSPARFLILDEPFTGLDPETKKEAIRCLLARADGRLILLATHSEEDAALLGGHIVRLPRAVPEPLPASPMRENGPEGGGAGLP